MDNLVGQFICRPARAPQNSALGGQFIRRPSRAPQKSALGGQFED